MITNLNYWFNVYNGPTQGILVLPTYHIELNFRDRSHQHFLFTPTHYAIGEALLGAGGWVGSHEGETPSSPLISVPIQPGSTPSEVAQTIRDAYSIFHKENQRILADPALHLARELKRHDWYYEMSDDNYVWRAGGAHWTLICRLVRELPEDIGRKIWKENAPANFEYPE